MRHPAHACLLLYHCVTQHVFSYLCITFPCHLVSWIAAMCILYCYNYSVRAFNGLGWYNDPTLHVPKFMSNSVRHSTMFLSFIRGLPWGFETVLFYGLTSDRRPTPPPLPTWRASVSLFVWVITFNVSGVGGPTSSYATASIALRIIWPHKPHHSVKVCIPRGGGGGVKPRIPVQTKVFFPTIVYYYVICGRSFSCADVNALSQGGKSGSVSTTPLKLQYPCHSPARRFIRRDVQTDQGVDLTRDSILLFILFFRILYGCTFVGPMSKLALSVGPDWITCVRGPFLSLKRSINLLKPSNNFTYHQV
jgi:hypothetical protein